MSSAERSRTPWWVAAVGAALVVVGLVMWLTQPPGTSMGAAPGRGASASGPEPGSVPEPVRAPWEPGAPRRVLIPALAVAAPVVPVRASNDTLIPPSDPTQLGWWADGARPGDARGSALIAGHTVHTGGGALDDLEQLRPGDPVVVGTDRGRITYQVVRVRVYSKGRIARDAERLFSQDVPGRLLLITCADWDGSRYMSNVVVTARAVST